MQEYSYYLTAFEAYLEKQNFPKNPSNLYDPIHHILNTGGKRLRPILTLIGAEIFDTPFQKALDAALCVEYFHNFSLIHDDLMDNAQLRRGEETVHEKWDDNIAILSGDVLMIKSFQTLEFYKNNIHKSLLNLVSKTAICVCEGQQLDMDFETSNTIDVALYLKMIHGKTAALIGAALQMGAIVAEAKNEAQKQLYTFGINLGMAFQLQDDYLDTFGTTASLGKKIGGDILENKKTYLYLKAIENATSQQKKQLTYWFTNSQKSEQKINEVTLLYKETKAHQHLLEKQLEFSHLASQSLSQLNLKPAAHSLLNSLVENLSKRTV